MVTNVSQSNFKSEIEKSSIPVIVDFWAEWCGPCKAVAPVINALSKEYEGKVKFVKINVDNEPEIAGQYAIRSIPTLVLVKDGKTVETKVGALGMADFKKWVDSIL